MARRVDHSHEELREMILQAARELVEQGGADSLSARKVASKIGYAPGTIYNIFKNIDELVLHLNAQTLEKLYQSLPAIETSQEVEVNLNKLLGCYLSFIEENKFLWRILFDYSPTKDQPVPDWYDGQVSKLLDLMGAALASQMQQDKPEDIRKASATLWASLHGVISLADKGKLDVVASHSVHETCEFLITTFLSGLKTKRIG